MCKHCNWEELATDVQEMLDGPDFKDAQTLLTGLRDWMLHNEHITDPQRSLIERLKKARLPQEDKRARQNELMKRLQQRVVERQKNSSEANSF